MLVNERGRQSAVCNIRLHGRVLIVTLGPLIACDAPGNDVVGISVRNLSEKSRRVISVRSFAARMVMLTLVVAGVSVPVSTGPIQQIIPGVQVGPVRLGIPADEAARVALAFERATGCQIDLLTVAGRVAAAGTRFGGCLGVSVPQGAPQSVIWNGPPPIPVSAGIGEPASAFIAAFGDPLQVQLASERVALVWRQGLVALVEGIHDSDGTVTYLAVVAPRRTAVPAIGYLRIFLKSGFEEF